ncbi:MAG: TonB-dependent receptor [Alphaproteobacteria bacterium]|nr:TonB-dependent receptor [Alphaproteobacteria bacterium]
MRTLFQSCFFSFLVCLASSTGWAQDIPPIPAPTPAPAPPSPMPSPMPSMDLGPIVVSATRVPTPQAELGSSVTVITADDIQRKQQRTLPEVLQDAPGLYLQQTGSPGGATSVYLRGTNANHTKVLIDGVEANDPSAPDGTFDFSQILASDIERVEILRGPQSGLYGSDAIGGVINIVTRTGSGPPQVRAMMEGGLYNTFNQTAGVSGSISRFNYDVNFSHYHSGDTPVTPADLVPPGRTPNADSYDNKTYGVKLGAGLTENFDVGIVARYVDTSLLSTSDDFLGPEPLRTISDNQQLFTRGTAHLVLFDGVFEQTAGLAYTNYHRNIFDPNTAPAAPNVYNGGRIKADWTGNITVMPGEVVTLGAEHQLDRIDDNTPVTASMTNDAGFMQLQSTIGEHLFNAVSLRYDSYDRFGSKATYRVAPAILLPETGSKLKASVGTGFKAPSLDQLFQDFPAFNFFANPDLKPETSLGYDAGFEQALLDERVRFGVTYFHNDIKNLIDFNNTFTSFVNIGRATTRGAEAFVAVHPFDPLTLRADYTFTLARDDTTGAELARRPKNKASLNAALQVNPQTSLTAAILYVGPWIDVSRDGSVTGLMASGYTLVNLGASYDLGNGVTAFARVNNLLNRHYQEPIGFLHQGIGVFGGVRAAFNSADYIK